MDKLRNFLSKRSTLREECGVVYFFVEIRKLIEDDRKNYRTLYFYCCWVAHSKLSYSNIADFLSNKFDGFIDTRKSRGEIQKDLINGQKDFFKLRDLNKELRIFLNGKNLPTSFLEGYKWHNFCQLFLDIVMECEIDISGINKKTHKINRLIVEKINGQYLYGFFLANGLRIPRIILKYKNK